MSEAQTEPFDPAALEALLHDVPLEVTVELGRIRMNLSELAAHLGPGSIITLDTPTGAPLDVRVNNVAGVTLQTNGSGNQEIGGP